jgi:hypothetical protein
MDFMPTLSTIKPELLIARTENFVRLLVILLAPAGGPRMLRKGSLQTCDTCLFSAEDFSSLGTTHF